MEPVTIVLFGATGDLAKRKIYPALYHLFLDGKLPQPFSLIGLGRREWTDESFRTNVETSLRPFLRQAPGETEALRGFLGAFRYCVLDIGREEHYRNLSDLIERREAELRMPPNRLFYLSVGPEYFEPIALNIRESGLGSANGWKRLVVEKPFGKDLNSARELNRTLSQVFTENEIFRIDHYLGKPVVQRLGSVMQGNPAIRELWANRGIANVQITANESIGLEGRAGYYDQAGAVRDMFQNHMLQLLMMAAIHIPDHGAPDSIRLRKIAVAEALEPVRKENAGAHVIRAQYAEGTIGGEPVPGYRNEPGISPDSMTDTFIAARVRIDNDDWRGVPFYIRTGKRTREKSTRIVVEFKDAGPRSLTGDERLAPNLLVIEIGPKESVSLRRVAKGTESFGAFEPIPIDPQPDSPRAPEAYETLMYDALRGDATYFAHWEEVERSWQWVQPILDAFAERTVPLLTYPAGSYGPSESDGLLAEDGFHWWLDDHHERNNDNSEGERYAYHAND
ncbi:glucose-6-phosphate dehydrogenase [Paenibacillus sp. GYB003]|uniref:glucose-6-phosphate dehydrogenase n=1 Tax=Paenibacillus sp. GYB003 TaxID=2994392 RepID=UPI002F96682B